MTIRNGFQPRMTRRGRDLSGHARAEPLTVLVELRTMGEAVERIDPAAIAFVHCWQDRFTSLWFWPTALDEPDRVCSFIAPQLQTPYIAWTSNVRSERVLQCDPEAAADSSAALERCDDPVNAFRRELVVILQLLRWRKRSSAQLERGYRRCVSERAWPSD